VSTGRRCSRSATKRICFRGTSLSISSAPQEIDGSQNPERHSERVPNRRSSTCVTRFNLCESRIPYGAFRAGNMDDLADIRLNVNEAVRRPNRDRWRGFLVEIVRLVLPVRQFKEHLAVGTISTRWCEDDRVLPDPSVPPTQPSRPLFTRLQLERPRRHVPSSRPCRRSRAEPFAIGHDRRLLEATVANPWMMK